MSIDIRIGIVCGDFFDRSVCVCVRTPRALRPMRMPVPGTRNAAPNRPPRQPKTVFQTKPSRFRQLDWNEIDDDDDIGPPMDDV